MNQQIRGKERWEEGRERRGKGDDGREGEREEWKGDGKEMESEEGGRDREVFLGDMQSTMSMS